MYPLTFGGIILFHFDDQAPMLFHRLESSHFNKHKFTNHPLDRDGEWY